MRAFARSVIHPRANVRPAWGLPRLLAPSKRSHNIALKTKALFIKGNNPICVLARPGCTMHRYVGSTPAEDKQGSPTDASWE